MIGPTIVRADASHAAAIADMQVVVDRLDLTQFGDQPVPRRHPPPAACCVPPALIPRYPLHTKAFGLDTRQRCGQANGVGGTT